jgi:hypothetical protein
VTVTRPEHQGAAAGELPVRIVVNVQPAPQWPITVDVSNYDRQRPDARVVIGAQQIVVPELVIRALYAVLHGIYGGGPLA